MVKLYGGQRREGRCIISPVAGREGRLNNGAFLPV